MVVIKKVAYASLLLIVGIQNLFADMMQKGKTKVKTVLNFYHQNSTEGKQVYDNSGREEANVIEPMIFIEHQINENTALTGQFVFDFWTAASDTKLDGNTGASGGEPIKTQSRVSGNIGIRKEVGTLDYGFNLGFSSEYDYKSLNGSFNVAKGFAKDNFTLGFSAQYYSDKVSLFQDLSSPTSAVITNDLPRDILATSLTASQILTRKDIIQFSLSYIEAKKNLESTASTVLIGGQRQIENLPDSRKRYAFSTHYVHGLGEGSAINVNYRYYTDKWDLDASTLRLAYLFEINDDEDFIELFARYHDQTSAKYFSKTPQASVEFKTSDSDLDAFSSYEIGAYHSFALDDINVFGTSYEELSWSNSIVYQSRSNGLDYAYIQTAFEFKF